MKHHMTAHDDMLIITENVVSDISLSTKLDLNFFLRLFYFYLVEWVYKKRDTQTLGSISGLHNFLPSPPYLSC